MKKIHLPSLLATGLWTMACLSVLILNLNTNKPDGAIAKKAWWSGQTIAEVKHSEIFLSEVRKHKLDFGSFNNFQRLKDIFDQDGGEPIALFYLTNLSQVSDSAAFDAKSFEQSPPGPLAPETSSLVGSLITKLAQYDVSNIDKLAWVKLGQDMMDKAVSTDPQNPIPHIIRFYNANAMPDFLQRKDLLQTDSAFLKGTKN